MYYGLAGKEKRSCIFRRSLFVTRNIKKGESFNEENIRSIRPAYGLAPKYIKNIFGKKAKMNIKKGTPLNRKLISDGMRIQF